MITQDAREELLGMSRCCVWYVEVLCNELRKRDKIKSEDIESFWKEVNRLKEKLPFPHETYRHSGVYMLLLTER